VSAVVREFQEDLERIKARAAGNAAKEVQALYLLALEREQLVTTQYSGGTLHARVQALQAPERIRALVHHALHWAARDEDMHTVYARGVLLRRGKGRNLWWLFANQLGGLIAGWSSAVSQHVTWSSAPLSRLGSLVVSVLGLLGGKVPKSARKTLGYQSFREFCLFNVEAEKTAAMCWQRLAELDAHDAVLYRRVAEDELRHSRVFAAFAECFDDLDRFDEAHSEAAFAQKLSDAHPAFVPRNLRQEDNPLGTGGTVHVRHGAPAAELLRSALMDSGLWARVLGRVQELRRVAIKTDFMMSYDRRDRTTLVDVELLSALVARLRAAGAEDVVILDTSNHYDRYYLHRSVEEVAAYMGVTVPGARVADTWADRVPHTSARGLGQKTVSRAWKEADLRISLAKMRTNPSFLVHLSLANLETLGQRIDELLFADRVADACTGLMMVLDEYPCHLALLDATTNVPDGLTGIIGTSTPRHPGRLYAAEDAIALDWVAARHMGLKELPRATSCRAALDWFGDARVDTVVDGIDTPIEPFINPHHDDLRILLASLAYPVYAYLSDGGSLWVPKMDPQAFPLKTREGMFTFAARRILRMMFRFGSPVEEWE
jgi:uncharacterized protein (DUF362 family)